MQIDFLADHPSFITQIAKWCNLEWPWYYNGGDLNAAVLFHQKTAQKSSIPAALVAVEGSEALGTIAIIEQDMEIRPNLTPWLGCLFVAPQYRGRGVAGHLLREGFHLAERLGVREIFAWTESLSESLKKGGWKLIETTPYQGRSVDILSIEVSAGRQWS